MSSETDSSSPLASVIYLGIPGFERQPVAEQARLRAELENTIAAALTPLDEGERVVLDAPDAAAIVVLSNPLTALLAAQHALSAPAGNLFAVGLNHGPVMLKAGERNDSRLIGDGIDAAVSIAGFASAGSLLVSRSFRDTLAQYAPDHAARMQGAGTFTDAGVRAHELFSLDPAAQRWRSRWHIAFAALACVAILASGVVARSALQGLAASRLPALLVFDIRPHGEIYVDGVLKGRAPAITRLQIAAGAHTLEVRNGRYPPFVTEVNLGPGEEMQVTHSFTAPAAKKSRGVLERLKFW